MANKMVKTFKAQIRSIDEKNFTVETVVSDASMDRYGEVVSMDAWKKGLKEYKHHPVLLSSHDYGNLQSQIGMAEKVWVEEDALVARFKYFVGEGNKEADWGFRLAQKGIAAYSIGFIPKEIERPEYVEGKMGKTIPWRIYKEVELLEISHVLIPANANARMKHFDDQDPLAREMAFEIEGKSLTLGCDEFEESDINGEVVPDEEELPTENEKPIEEIPPEAASFEAKGKSADQKEENIMMLTIDAEAFKQVLEQHKNEIIAGVKELIASIEPAKDNSQKNIEILVEKTVDELRNIDNDENEEVYIKQIMEHLDDMSKIFRSDDKVNEQGNELDK